MKERIAAILVAMMVSLAVKGQSRDVSYADSRVRTVEFRHSGVSDRRQVRVPQIVVCHLQTPEELSLDFDVIGTETDVLYYTFRHLDRHGEDDDLMDMEFCEGINRFDGRDYSSLSFNTTTSYVHYHLDISTEPLKVSGQYAVEVRTATEDNLVVRVPLWISEESMGVRSRVERRGGKQNLSLSVSLGETKLTTVEEMMMVAVWQNKRLDDIREVERPTIVRPGEVVYQDQENLEFEGGAEWLWADTRSIRRTLIRDAAIEYFEPFYHFTLSPDYPMNAYTMREDWNGGSWVQTDDRVDDKETAADYVMVHFKYVPVDGKIFEKYDIHVIGDASGWEPTNANRLEPIYEEQCYRGNFLFKQGLANYTYLKVPKKGRDKTGRYAMGSYHETENDYFIAVYIRQPQDTYDRLVCVKTHNTLRGHDDFIR
ncbi:MAG: DUF5103 domain-containing protein [Bacteroidales bacterium]|nr:DUF5103 domain-containing protein [Bacteroidales bacterium]